MIGNKLMQLLETLSEKDMRGFEHFLDFDQPQQLTLCKKCLRVYCQIINTGKSLNNQDLASKCLGREGSEKQLRYITSYLSKSLETYISWINIRDQAFALEISRLQYYNQVGLNDAFDKLGSKLIDQLMQLPDRSIDHYKSLMLVYKELYVNKSRQGRTGNMFLSEWRSATYNYFTTELLRQEVLLYSYEIHNPGHLDVYRESIKHLLIHAQVTGSGKMYSLLEKLLVLSEPRIYDELSEQFKAKQSIFKKYEAKNILLLLINYCIKQINEGNISFQQHCLDWYYWGLDQNILLDDEVISKYTYKNMLSLTIKFKDFDEGYRILETYKNLLKERERESVYQFNYGRILFHQKKYQQAMRILQVIDSPTLMDNLDVRRMLLRMYYEEGDFDLLDSHLVSFGSFLRRHKDLGYHRGHYQNLVNFTGKLMRTRSSVRRQSIKENISNCQTLVDKDWLLSMI